MIQAVTSSGISEAGYIAISEAVEEVLVLRQEAQNFMELSMGSDVFTVRQDQAY